MKWCGKRKTGRATRKRLLASQRRAADLITKAAVGEVMNAVRPAFCGSDRSQGNIPYVVGRGFGGKSTRHRVAHEIKGKLDRAARTSTQLSSFISRASSLTFEPLTATRLLGGARSSVLLTAGLFLSSILGRVADGRGEAEGGVVVTAGIRKRVVSSAKSGSLHGQTSAWATARPLSQVSSRSQMRGRS